MITWFKIIMKLRSISYKKYAIYVEYLQTQNCDTEKEGIILKLS